MSHWVVIGAGYTGARVAAQLRARGDQVAVTRRTPDRVEPAAVRTGARGVVIDLATVTVEELTVLYDWASIGCWPSQRRSPRQAGGFR